MGLKKIIILLKKYEDYKKIVKETFFNMDLNVFKHCKDFTGIIISA